jgi:hypothetical protein
MLAAGCKQNKSKLDDLPRAAKVTQTGSASGSAAQDNAIDIDSKDILDRKESADVVQVKHVLIGWDALDKVYNGRMDPRAQKRTNADAAKLAKEIADKLRKDPDSIDALVKEHSEDPGSQSGEPYEVKADAPFVPEFKALALHLKEKEVGIVKTRFGYHVMERVLPPPPDALESADILKRVPVTQKARVKHILLGWKDNNGGGDDARGKARDRAALEKLVKETIGKLQKGEKIEALMTSISEDPGSAKSGDAYPVTPDAGLVEPFKNLSLRLKPGEVGAVKTDFGIHIIQRCSKDDGQPADPCIQ